MKVDLEPNEIAMLRFLVEERIIEATKVEVPSFHSSHEFRSKLSEKLLQAQRDLLIFPPLSEETGTQWHNPETEPPPFDTDVLCYDRERDRLFVGCLHSGYKSVIGSLPATWWDEDSSNPTVDLWAMVERPRC